MHFGLNDEARQRAADLVRAINANTAAIKAQTEAMYQTAPVLPPHPEPAVCCEHGAGCTRSTER